MANRKYSQHELNQVAQAEKLMRQKGLVVDETEDKDSASANAAWIVSWLDANPNVPVTIENVLRACEDMKDKLVWKTQAAMDYESEYNNLTPAQKDAFGSWWFSPSTTKTIVIDGQHGYYNAAKILQWCKGRGTLNHATFNLAVSNLASSHGGLYWAPTPKRVDPRQYEDSGSFMPKSDTNLSALEQARKRAAPEEKQTAAPTVDYKALAESVTTGRTHSDTAKLPKLFVMHPGTSEIDWETTYFARLRLSEGKK